MQTYLVGGAVRDALLGLPGSDRDWVVVGATPEEMVARRATCRWAATSRSSCIPQTREEYALARTERKSAPGYRGFAVHAAPDVTLEQDLARRDLTINAIALPADRAGRHAGPRPPGRSLPRPARPASTSVLRHVTDAFREDPVRILRVARFAARFADFSVAPETLALMREMVAAGEADALVPERVWQELARGLMEDAALAHVRAAARMRRAGRAAARGRPPVGRAAARGPPPRGRHRRAPDDGAGHGGAPGCAARGALRLPGARPRQGHHAGRRAAAPHRPRAAQRGAAARRCASAGACRWSCASWPRWWRASTATSTAAANSARRRWCACSSAATRFASRSASTQALLACECDARGRLGLRGAALSAARAAAGGAGRGAVGRNRTDRARGAAGRRRRARRSARRSRVRAWQPCRRHAAAVRRHRTKTD